MCTSTYIYTKPMTAMPIYSNNIYDILRFRKAFFNIKKLKWTFHLYIHVLQNETFFTVYSLLTILIYLHDFRDSHSFNDDECFQLT